MGPFDYQFSRQEVSLYRDALGLSDSEEVPIGIATRALTEPLVLEKLRIVFEDRIPVHLAQSINVLEALKPGTCYRFSLLVEDLGEGRVGLTGTFTTPTNGVCAVLRGEFLSVQGPALK